MMLPELWSFIGGTCFGGCFAALAWIGFCAGIVILSRDKKKVPQFNLKGELE